MSPPWPKNVHLAVFKKIALNSECVTHQSYINYNKILQVRNKPLSLNLKYWLLYILSLVCLADAMYSACRPNFVSRGCASAAVFVYAFSQRSGENR